MVKRPVRCDVSTECKWRPYVAVWVTVESSDDMKPFNPVTTTCRRHISMVIEHVIARGLTARVKGIA